VVPVECHEVYRDVGPTKSARQGRTRAAQREREERDFPVMDTVPQMAISKPVALRDTWRTFNVSTVAHIMLAATHCIKCPITFSFFSTASTVAGRIRLCHVFLQSGGPNHYTGSELV
jgi:hypothetical protein